jgi:two-component system osmolarity sensor histidine kinase EnvZ
VNLSREALRHADSIQRVALVKAMTDARGHQGSHRASRRQAGIPFEVDRFTESRRRGDCAPPRPDTIVASSVNGTSGLWVGFTIETDPYWLQADAARIIR